MLTNIFFLFFLIVVSHLILIKLKINLSFFKVIFLFYIPVLIYLIFKNIVFLDKIYYILSYNLLFAAYYFTILGITNDSPSLIIIREILKKNNKVKNIKKKFLSEKLIQKRFIELDNDNYTYLEKKNLMIRKNKTYLINIFIQLRKLQDQANKKNG